jgi:hypothetical protein
MAVEKEIKLETPETLTMKENGIRVLEHGAEEARTTKIGDPVTVSGMDKQELLSRGLAVRPAAKEAKK